MKKIIFIPIILLTMLYVGNVNADVYFKCSINEEGTCHEQLVNFCKNEASTKISAGNCNGDCNNNRQKKIAEFEHYKYCLSYYENALTAHCVSNNNQNLDNRWKNILDKKGDISYLDGIYTDLNNCMTGTTNDKICSRNDDMLDLTHWEKTTENIIKFCHLQNGTSNIQTDYKMSSSSSCEIDRMKAYHECLSYYYPRRLSTCISPSNNNWEKRWETVHKYQLNNDLETYKGLYRDLDSCYLNKGYAADNGEDNEVTIFDDVKLYDVVTCGNIELPTGTVSLISTAITILQIAVPLILIVTGMLDFTKATVASKEEDMKKAQQSFIRRLIAGAIVFFVIVVVKIVIGILNTDNSNSILNCVDSFLNGVDTKK